MRSGAILALVDGVELRGRVGARGEERCRDPRKRSGSRSRGFSLTVAISFVVFIAFFFRDFARPLRDSSQREQLPLRRRRRGSDQPRGERRPSQDARLPRASEPPSPPFVLDRRRFGKGPVPEEFRRGYLLLGRVEAEAVAVSSRLLFWFGEKKVLFLGKATRNKLSLSLSVSFNSPLLLLLRRNDSKSLTPSLWGLDDPASPRGVSNGDERSGGRGGRGRGRRKRRSKSSGGGGSFRLCSRGTRKGDLCSLALDSACCFRGRCRRGRSGLRWGRLLSRHGFLSQSAVQLLSLAVFFFLL